MKPRTRLLLGGPLAFVLVSVLIAVAAKKTNELARALYESYLEAQFTDLGTMCVDFQNKQLDWIQLVPPGMPCLLQETGIRCFKPQGFPKEFIDGLVPVQHDGYVTYPITVYEDYQTREYVFLNANAKEFYTVQPPLDYDPLWLLYRIFPDFNPYQYTQQQLDDLIWQYDPARVAIGYELILKQDLLTYLEQIHPPPGEEPPPIIMKAYEGPPVDEIQFTAIEPVDNGVELTIAYPNDFTNHLDIFSCDSGTGLLDFWWDLRITTNIDTSTNWIEWVDTDATNATADIRFYAAGNADINAITDPDDDGLTWAREKYMYHTCPTNSDTDGDGIDDPTEIDNRTDPNNPDTNSPTAVITSPTNNFSVMWMP